MNLYPSREEYNLKSVSSIYKYTLKENNWLTQTVRRDMPRIIIIVLHSPRSTETDDAVYLRIEDNHE